MKIKLLIALFALALMSLVLSGCAGPIQVKARGEAQTGFGYGQR